MATPSEIPCHQIDAFTDRPFRGNPAAVCPLDAWLPDELMQAIAAENNLAETAFFVPRAGTGDFDLRWFTPAAEVELCGHATLASAFLLMTELEPRRERVRFHSKSGPLDVTRADGGRFTLDFPSRPPAPVTDADTARAVAAALRLPAPPASLLRARDVLVVLAAAADVRALKPDLDAVSRLDTFAVIVSAQAGAPADGPDADVDFVSRFFAPAKGVPEDPVTGSAHCTLTPYWAARLGKSRLRARQVSPRGGELLCELTGERVRMTGHAVKTRSGRFHLPPLPAAR
jgi:PhzF family phenazine biosynthesis protein